MTIPCRLGTPVTRGRTRSPLYYGVVLALTSLVSRVEDSLLPRLQCRRSSLRPGCEGAGECRRVSSPTLAGESVTDGKADGDKTSIN